jgi:hypothetical protein
MLRGRDGPACSTEEMALLSLSSCKESGRWASSDAASRPRLWFKWSSSCSSMSWVAASCDKSRCGLSFACTATFPSTFLLRCTLDHGARIAGSIVNTAHGSGCDLLYHDGSNADISYTCLLFRAWERCKPVSVSQTSTLFALRSLERFPAEQVARYTGCTTASPRRTRVRSQAAAIATGAHDNTRTASWSRSLISGLLAEALCASRPHYRLRGGRICPVGLAAYLTPPVAAVAR